MPNLIYPGGILTCGKEGCLNNDPAKFIPIKVIPGSSEPLNGINIKCLKCGTVYDMSKVENHRP